MIYYLEATEYLRDMVVDTLLANNFIARGFENAKAFFDAVKSKMPDLVILDLVLNDMNGMQIIESLRQNEPTKDLPVLVVTGQSSEYETVMALNSGADDYMYKPFSINELLARLCNLLRRTGKSGRQELLNGPLRINFQKYTVFSNDDAVLLTQKEFETLSILTKNVGMPLTRDEILRQVWGYSFDGENRTVDVHIRRLRKKLGESGELIETIRGMGYRLKDMRN